MNPESRVVQQQIIEELGIPPAFDVALETQRCITFLADYLVRHQRRALVLGISGGIDSATAGRLSKLAVEQVRRQGGEAVFIAMRLPYGRQLDEDDAQCALAFVAPDEVLTVDMQPASDAMLSALKAAGMQPTGPAQEDSLLGNVKARQRMVAQYAVASQRQGLVVGSDEAAEAVMGYFTKHGDYACDLAVLSRLTKRRVRAMATHLGMPERIVRKTPTADLESLRPQRPAEADLGVTFAELDDFLEGRDIDEAAARRIVAAYRATAHKRAPPPRP